MNEILSPNQRVVIGMYDGLGMAYYNESPLPTMKSMAERGFFRKVTAVFPSVTNVNNVSIGCGTWPKEHGIVANSYYVPETGKTEYMNAAEMIQTQTLFQRAKAAGDSSALLTSKRKTLELFKECIDIGIAAESATPEIEARYGKAPDIYSREINYWLWEIAVDILKNRPDIKVLYVHITDYPMHAWEPSRPESQEHLARLDELLAQAEQVAPDAAFFMTADHSMNFKKRCWDLARVCETNGCSLKFALSPERDYYIQHHRNFTGCAWVWLNDPDDERRVRDIIDSLEGVEGILGKEEAAHRFHLPSTHLGDLVVLGDRDTMFGELETPGEDLPETYRAHGSLHEMDVPLIIFNQGGTLPPADVFEANKDLTRFLYR